MLGNIKHKYITVGQTGGLEFRVGDIANNIWKRLFTGTVPVNKEHLPGTVHVNKKHPRRYIKKNNVF